MNNISVDEQIVFLFEYFLQILLNGGIIQEVQKYFLLYLNIVVNINLLILN